MGLFLAISSVGASPSQDQTPSYLEVSLDLEFALNRGAPPQADSRSRTVSVRCVTGNNVWRIDHNNMRGSDLAWSSDGTNVYMRLGPIRLQSGDSNVTINVWEPYQGHPLADPAANITWLAFCSGNYLRQTGRLVPLPLDELRHTRDRFAYTDKVITFADEPRLPRMVDLFLSKSLFLASETAFDKDYNFGTRYTEWTKSIADKLPEGTHMFHYEVTETTNFAGSVYPVSFAFWQNGRSFEQNGDNYWRGTGRVKGIRLTTTPPESIFMPTFLQTIVDHRARDGTGH